MTSMKDNYQKTIDRMTRGARGGLILNRDQKMKVFDAILRKVRDEGPGDYIPEYNWAEELTADIEAALVDINKPLPPMIKQPRAAAGPQEPAP